MALAAVGVPRRHARRLIACGAAGPVIRTKGALLVDDQRVAALAAREHLGAPELDAVCPWGLFVARRDVPVPDNPQAHPDGSAHPDDSARPDDPAQLALLGERWTFSIYTAVWIRSRIERHGFLPIVATVSGFVLGGGDITAVTVLKPSADLHDLTVEPPSAWFDRVKDTRVDTPPGRPWMVLGWDPRARVG
jgi:hypothetical protein